MTIPSHYFLGFLYRSPLFECKKFNSVKQKNVIPVKENCNTSCFFPFNGLCLKTMYYFCLIFILSFFYSLSLLSGQIRRRENMHFTFYLKTSKSSICRTSSKTGIRQNYYISPPLVSTYLLLTVL